MYCSAQTQETIKNIFWPGLTRLQFGVGNGKENVIYERA